MKISIIKKLLPSALLLAGFFVFGAGQAHAAFDAGRIIDDSVFTNKGAMSVGEIQNFLNSKVPVCDTNHAPGSGSQGEQPPWVCLKNFSENGKSAAQIIWEAGQTYNINPQVIIVTLQKENGLITDTWPYDWQYRTAMGMGCPDGAACDAQYFGFTNQVNQGARHLAGFYNQNPGWYIPYRPGTSYVKWHPNAACGGTNVNIANRATASLYSYTPYQPNGAALANMYGTGDGCSSYGNRNFWRDFTSWFGTTLGVAYASSYAGQSSYPTLAPGQSTTAYFSYQNNGNMPWYDNVTAGGAGVLPVHLSTSRPINRTSIFGSTWGGDQNRPTGVFSAVYESDGITLATNQHIALPGQIAKFTFTITAPSNAPLGNHREFFQPIVEGGSSMNDPWTFLDISVVQDYQSQFFGQSDYPRLLPGKQTTAWIMYKNVGSKAWYDDTGSSPVYIQLATGRPTRRSSQFSQGGWGPGNNIPATKFAAVYESNGATLATNQSIVQPGQIAKFNITFTAPTNIAPGTYREFFLPVADTGASSNDPWTFLDVTIETPRYTSAYAGQSPYPRLLQGQQTTSWFKYKNTGNMPWYDNVTAGGAGVLPVHLATSHPINASNPLGSVWGGDQNRPTGVFAAVYEADGVTLAANQHIVQPGQIAKIEFILKATQTTPPGIYRTFMQPIVEGGTTMNDPWTFLDVTVSRPVYASAYYNQGPYLTLNKGASGNSYIMYKNVGDITWYDNVTAGGAGVLPVHLATSHPLNRVSPLGSSWGGDRNRSNGAFDAVYEVDGVTLAANQHIVQPGQIAKFNITFTAPVNIASGLYREYFQPIVEGGTTMNDPWTFLDVTVN